MTATVLIVDDEVEVRRFIQVALERRGYHVLLAEDGLAGVEAFEAHRAEVDLVVLDMIMPRLDGRGAFERLRALSSDLPILLCSGFAGVEVADLLDAGRSVFLEKPFAVIDLYRIVAELVTKG